MKYNDLDYSFNHDILQKAFVFTNKSHKKWTDSLSSFDVELLKDFSWGEIPDNLLKAINYKEDNLEQFSVKEGIKE